LSIGRLATNYCRAYDGNDIFVLDIFCTSLLYKILDFIFGICFKASIPGTQAIGTAKARKD